MKIMKLKVRLRQWYFRAIPFLLLILYHNAYGLNSENPNESRTGEMPCNASSQYVKVSFSSQIVKNGEMFLTFYAMSFS